MNSNIIDNLHELISTDIIIKINQLGEEYKTNPGIILTEADMQCLLYKKLLEIDILSQLYDTKDGYKAYAVHTELSWFDLDKKLTLKPDITILAPDYLTITKFKNIDFPTKGCMFMGGGIIFELKLNRYKSMKSFIKSVKQDLEKIANLQTIHPNAICYFVWFNKYNVESKQINDLITEHNNGQIKIIYIKGSMHES
jgi:hypothetical protein